MSPLVHLFRLKRNCGKGASIRFGLGKVTGDLVLVHDADLEYHPTDIPALLEPALHHGFDVVFGSRFLHVPRRMSVVHRIGNEFLSRLANRLFHARLTDVETGFKLFSKALIERLDLCANEFEIEPEIAAKVLMRGIPVAEIPVQYAYRAKGLAKINFGDGLDAMLVMVLVRLGQDPERFIPYRVFKVHVKRLLTWGRNLIRGTRQRPVLPTC